MRISAVYVRFYRAFNFDYLAKHRGNEPHPWDAYEDGFHYPYIEVALDDAVTCVVGANESGKSQLLEAIEHASTGSGVEPSDFCRYSSFFAVDADLRTPQFGIELTDLSSADQAAVVPLLGLDSATTTFSRLHLFRPRPDELVAYLDRGEPVPVSNADALGRLLPASFRIDPAVPIPNSVSISQLADRAAAAGPDRLERWAITDPFVENSDAIAQVFGVPDKLAKLLARVFSGGLPTAALSDRERKARERQAELAYDLLVTVGGVDPGAFRALHGALRREDEGFANGLVARINLQLSKSLNLRKWWTQDEHFDLQVAARDYELVFTVRDRTLSEYSFAERSSGLKYFLSYLVQYLARAAQPDCPQILLMDEPDAFLSQQGQQDLLKLFADFTSDPELHRQVVFVTHSPFLIDKNRADRIRVLDKGSGDEGTRVVRNVGHNHYEPLRSALGAFVGETTFIGNCNLMVEGISDQIFIAGMSDVLRQLGRSRAERLDLNTITLVPAGSASQIPYLVYLARGRDVDQPAVVVLLDGDQAGNDARKALQRGGPRGKQVLSPEFVVQIGDEGSSSLKTERPEGPVDIEDLVPLELGLAAAEAYLRELSEEVPDPFPSVADVRDVLSPELGVLDGIRSALKKAGVELAIEKVGFARHVVDVARGGGPGSDDAAAVFAGLFSVIGEKQRAAERARGQANVGARVERLKSSFLQDYPEAAGRADLRLLLEEIEARLDDTLESDQLIVEIRRIREAFVLDGDLAAQVEDYPTARAKLEALQYRGLLASEQ